MTNLKRIRKEKNITQGALAERAGVSLRTLQDYEQGQKDINGARGITLYRLSEALNCDMRDLLEITEG